MSTSAMEILKPSTLVAGLYINSAIRNSFSDVATFIEDATKIQVDSEILLGISLMLIGNIDTERRTISRLSKLATERGIKFEVVTSGQLSSKLEAERRKVARFNGVGSGISFLDYVKTQLADKRVDFLNSEAKQSLLFTAKKNGFEDATMAQLYYALGIIRKSQGHIVVEKKSVSEEEILLQKITGWLQDGHTLLSEVRLMKERFDTVKYELERERRNRFD